MTFLQALWVFTVTDEILMTLICR